MTKAKVNPHQPWPQPGNADVIPRDNVVPLSVVLPVEQRAPGAYTVTKAQYPNGVVIVNPNFRTQPPQKEVEWTLKSTNGPQETLGPGWADGDGVVVLFHD